MNKYKTRPVKTKRWKRHASVLHLWLGLFSGIIVFVIAITGCIYVFHDELKDVVYDWRFVDTKYTKFATPSVLLETVKKSYPQTEPNMVVYQGDNRPASISVIIDKVPHDIYLNPYNAEIIHVQNLESEFFNVIERLHRFLLLPVEIGKQITGITTLIFIVMLLSGLVLWWPKKWNKAGQNFKIKWKARWRRQNYDWHRATGFYLILPALLIAITGLVFTYEWVEEGVYAIGNLTEDAADFEPPAAIPGIKTTSKEALDLAFSQTLKLAPDAGMYFVWDQGSGLPVLTGSYPTSLHFDHQSNYYFHPKTGDLMVEQTYDSKSGGLQLLEMTYGLHTGQYFKMPGKILAFFISLLIALLPVTGFLVWWGRRKKSKKNR